MRSTFFTAIRQLLLMTVLLGLLYPLTVTGLGRVFFHHKAEGSLMVRQGHTIGSELIPQPFSEPGYFWPRPSATSPAYNGGASSGSNLGPLNPALADSVRSRMERLQRADPENRAPIPVDLVTASGSGLDPHISPAAAYYQVGRVARARGLDEGTLRTLVTRQVEGRQLGILGEPRVNVLKLNLALNDLAPPK